MLGASAVADLLAEASRRSGVVPINARRCAMGELSSRIVAAAAEPVRFASLCRVVEREPRQISVVLQRLVRAGRVRRIERGLYLASEAA